MRWIVVLFLLLSGCAPKGYLLPPLPKPQELLHCQESIGVEVELSDYLLLGKIAFKEHEKLYLLDQTFAQDSEEFFEKELVRYLRKALKDKKVYRYPWEVEKMPQMRLRLVVDDLFVDRDRRVGIARAILFIEDRPQEIVVQTRWHKDMVATLQESINVLFEAVAKEVGRFCRQARDTRLQPDSER